MVLETRKHLASTTVTCESADSFFMPWLGFEFHSQERSEALLLHLLLRIYVAMFFRGWPCGCNLYVVRVSH